MELKSANFLLAGDVGERDLRDVARRLEEFREALPRLLPKASVGDKPTIVLVFRNLDAYRPFAPTYKGKPTESAGFFQPGSDVNYVSIVLDAGEDSYPLVFREFTHVFVNANYGSPPVWFDEGLAEYYTSFEVSTDGKQAKVGRPIQEHVDLLENYWLPLDEVLDAGPDSPLANESRNRDVFYAECWALVHYLLAGPAGRGPHVPGFLERLGAGMTREQASQEAFGISIATLERETRTYMRNRAFTWQRVVFAEPLAPRSSAPAHALTEAAVEARLGDLLWHMGRNDAAEAHLEKALLLEPEQSLAKVSLGELQLRRQRMAAQEGGAKAVVPPPGREAIPAGGSGMFYLRAVKEGEQRTFGSLERIECESARVLFQVRSGDAVVRFSAARMDAVDFLMYRTDLGRSVPCGARRPPDPVYVTWRPVAGKPDGEAIAVEFVPKDYAPKGKKPQHNPAEAGSHR